MGTINGYQIDQLNYVCGELEKKIVDKLNKSGLYYRIQGRVKSESSVEVKLNRYKEDKRGKRLQDVIGIRVLLYFYEDLEICREMLEPLFDLDNSSVSESKEDVFSPRRNNFVMKIPNDKIDKINPLLWDEGIDKTFELQIRTMLFEGWHEIEHDMRYKVNKDKTSRFWNDNVFFSRTLNCILANLELSDWAIVALFDDVAEEQINCREWELALRSRYRIRMIEESLSDEIRNHFDCHPDVFKKLLSVSKMDLVRHILEENLRKNNIKELTPKQILEHLCDIPNEISGNEKIDIQKLLV